MAKQNLVTINEKKRTKLIAVFKKAQESLLSNLNRDTWRVATTAYAVKNDKEYSLLFKNDKDFAKAVGYSAGAFSKLATVGKMNSFLQLNERGLTTGQAQELIPLFNLNAFEEFEDYQAAITTDAALTLIPQIVEFLSDYQDTIAQKTTKEIRALVNQRLYALSGNIQDDSADTESGDTEDDSNDNATDSVNVDDVIMSSAEIVDELVKIIKLEKGTVTYKYGLILALLSKEGLL